MKLFSGCLTTPIFPLGTEVDSPISPERFACMLLSKVVCPQQLDQFFWAERVRYLAVGAVLERSLFVERDPSPTKLPDSLVCQAAAAISSVLTPQVSPMWR